MGSRSTGSKWPPARRGHIPVCCSARTTSRVTAAKHTRSRQPHQMGQTRCQRSPQCRGASWRGCGGQGSRDTAIPTTRCGRPHARAGAAWRRAELLTRHIGSCVLDAVVVRALVRENQDQLLEPRVHLHVFWHRRPTRPPGARREGARSALACCAPALGEREHGGCARCPFRGGNTHSLRRKHCSAL